MRQKWVCGSIIGFFIIIILLVVPGGTGKSCSSPYLGNIYLANEMFLAAGVETKEIKLQAWGQINNEHKKVNEKDNLALIYEDLRESLSLNPEFQKVEKGNTGFCRIVHNEERNQGSWQLCLQESPLSEKIKEKYICLLFTTNNVSYAGEVYDILKVALENLGVKQEIGITFYGTINRRISCEEGKEIASLIQRLARAHYVEGVMNEELTSLSFYSTEIEGFLQIDGRKINLNIAFSYNEEEDATYLYVGLPLIFQEY